MSNLTKLLLQLSSKDWQYIHATFNCPGHNIPNAPCYMGAGCSGNCKECWTGEKKEEVIAGMEEFA